MKIFGTLLLIAANSVIISLASAAPLYWDAAGSDGANLGGSGPWDTNTARWFNGTTDIAWTNANNYDAYFGGAAGTVTLQMGISADDIYFTNATGNYYITNLTGAEMVTVANSIDTGGGEHTIAALIGNSSNLNKNGNGRLHLPVDNTAGLTGNVTINQGEVSVENNNALGYGTSATVNPGAAVEFNEGENTNGLNGIYNNFTIGGTGITNSGAMRNVSGVNYIYGNVTLTGNTELWCDSGQLTLFATSPIGASGNFNVTAAGPGTIYIGASGFNLGTGSLTIEGPSTFYMYVISTYASSMVFNNLVIESNASYYVEDDGDFGTVPATLMPTNIVIDGGTLDSFGSYTMSATRGITVTTNGGSILNLSGTFESCNIYSSNTTVTIGGTGNQRPGGAAGTTLGTVNLGTGGIIKVGSDDCNQTYAGTFTFSNIVISGGSFSEQYDYGLGSVPNSFSPANVTLNGGSLHADHTYYMSPTRGITITTNNGTIEEITGSAHLYIQSQITGPGALTVISGGSGAQVVLCAANNYTGGTTINSSANLTVGVGTNASTGTLPGNCTNNGSLTFNLPSSYVYSGQISGNGSLADTGAGMVTLTGANTYAGATTISGGALLLIDNTNASSSVSVATNSTLGGDGIISGPTTVSAGGTLALGGGIFSFSNNVSIAGNVSVLLNKSVTPSNGMAVVTGTLANTGTGSILVTNVGPALAVGDTFQLFSQALAGAGTMTVTGGGAVWNNNLANNGTISVQSITSLSKPVINQVSAANGNLIFSGTNEPAGVQYYVLSSTNVMLPLSQWTPILTNTFPATGPFSITNPIIPGAPHQFFILQVQ